MALAAVMFLTFVVTAYAYNESTEHLEFAAQDFGNIIHNMPRKVIFPSTVDDISSIVRQYYQDGKVSGSPVKIAARGNAYSTQGQAQTNGGVVINMMSLPGPTMVFNTTTDTPFVDVSAGELWINVLTESVKLGFTLWAWTDYLYLTVGGTLSTGGIGGQAFRKGPVIDQVLQLEVITGTGELKTITEETDSKLFYAVLGGLGQFGIITKARIALTAAPTRVIWIKALYSDFATMSKDQEALTEVWNAKTFDYVEGFVLINGASSSSVADWGSSYLTIDPLRTSKFTSNGKTQYSIELAKYYSPYEANTIDQKVSEILSGLNYIETSLSFSDVEYVEFLNRVHSTEMSLRNQGLWDIPHPWLNLMVQKNSIDAFVQEVFGNIITEPVNGPIIIYPFNRLIFNPMTSLVIPDEMINNIVYMVSILSAAPPSKTGELERLLALNKRVLDFCQQANLRVKEYLPHYTTRDEWSAHFGKKQWFDVVRKKRLYDPLAILAPGQFMFPNGTA